MTLDTAERRQPEAERHFGYKQRRSQLTFERLLDAAEELISAGQSLDDLSVTEVCARAGFSVGAFYRRFASKDGLLVFLHERYVERMFERQARSLDPKQWTGLSLDDTIRRLVEEAFRTLTRDVVFVRACDVRAQGDRDFAERARQLHADYVSLVTRLLLQHVEEFEHPHPRRAAEFCAYQLRATLYYFFVATSFLETRNGRGVNQILHTSVTERELVPELAASLRAYLCSAHPD